ncbi:MAG: hypothetical protein HYW62_04255 [Candidatus Levybacteria bacterium]|nr:hypothetical protein [Candidatus Levybacteria bacterium]
MKKILSGILILILFLFLTSHFSPLISPAFAQTPAPNTNPDVPNNLHNWTQNVMIEVMSALTCQLAGVDPTNPKQSCLGIDSASGKIGFLPKAGLPDEALAKSGGAIGFMGNMIGALYTSPLHTSDYFKDLASNFGINKKAYAQSAGGTGFQSLTPLIGIWSAFRNIVYLFLVIIFVVIGLAIMLRVKIDPRTVMSIQNQIPKIIIGILVVTFSFAIAGFLIDLMWVFIYLIYGIFSGIPGVNLNNLNPTTMQGVSPLGVQGFGSIALITWHSGNSIVGAVTNLLGLGLVDFSFMNILIHAISVGAGFFVAFFTEGFKVAGFSVPGVQEAIKGGAAAVLVEAGLRWAIPYAIAYIVIFIALLTALFRLWFTLIIAYVHILLDVVLAPFWIIGGIIPGSPISLSGWLRDIIANLAAFPAVIGMFMLGKVFMDAFTKGTPGQQFVPPLIGNPGDTSLIGSLIGLGIILMTPNVVNMLKSALKAPKIDTGATLKALGAGAGVPVASGKAVASFYHTPKMNERQGLMGVARNIFKF